MEEGRTGGGLAIRSVTDNVVVSGMCVVKVTTVMESEMPSAGREKEWEGRVAQLSEVASLLSLSTCGPWALYFLSKPRSSAVTIQGREEVEAPSPKHSSNGSSRGMGIFIYRAYNQQIFFHPVYAYLWE